MARQSNLESVGVSLIQMRNAAPARHPSMSRLQLHRNPLPLSFFHRLHSNPQLPFHFTARSPTVPARPYPIAHRIHLEARTSPGCRQYLDTRISTHLILFVAASDRQEHRRRQPRFLSGESVPFYFPIFVPRIRRSTRSFRRSHHLHSAVSRTSPPTRIPRTTAFLQTESQTSSNVSPSRALPITSGSSSPSRALRAAVPN